MIAAGEGLSRTELRARAREFTVNYVWTADATLADFLAAFVESLREPTQQDDADGDDYADRAEGKSRLR